MAPRDLAHAIGRLLGGPTASPPVMDGLTAALVALVAVLGVVVALWLAFGGPSRWR